ncbi:MAG: hypothetical protein ACR2MG_20490, partial [Pyrinomonadaceae bacterium]
MIKRNKTKNYVWGKKFASTRIAVIRLLEPNISCLEQIRGECMVYISEAETRASARVQVPVTAPLL